eukprot:9306198-Alexandrium_andersonii.AAC.1
MGGHRFRSWQSPMFERGGVRDCGPSPTVYTNLLPMMILVLGAVAGHPADRAGGLRACGRRTLRGRALLFLVGCRGTSCLGLGFPPPCPGGGQVGRFSFYPSSTHFDD